MRSSVTRLLCCVALLAVAGSAGGNDQLVKGVALAVRDPLPGADPTRREIMATAREAQSPETIIGNPTVAGGGAVLRVVANGGTPSDQVFALPQGISSTGQPFWIALGTSGFRYKDTKADQGPVKTLTIKRSSSAVFAIFAKVSGDSGTVNVIPPNPGTDGFLTVTIDGGDRYCVQYGADGRVKNNLDKGFKVSKVGQEGCPP